MDVLILLKIVLFAAKTIGFTTFSKIMLIVVKTAGFATLSNIMPPTLIVLLPKTHVAKPLVLATLFSNLLYN